MNAADLSHLVALGPTATVQFLPIAGDPHDLAKELCAFANARGGTIAFGVDYNGTTRGLSPGQIRELTRNIAEAASQVAREPVRHVMQEVSVGESQVLLVRVPESAAKPHIDSRGVIWTRTTTGKARVKSRGELRAMLAAGQAFDVDRQPVTRSYVADLDLAAFAESHRKVVGTPASDAGIDLDRLLENHNVAIDGCLTLAGLLFFGRQPQKYRPELVTKAVAWKTTEAEDSAGYFDSEDIGGTLPRQLAETMAFLRRNLLRAQSGQSVNSEGVLEIPEPVFEELLVNMLVHRNYFLTAPQTVFVFPDRIEIASPGHLPNKLTVDQAKSGNSIPRNPILQSMAAKLLPYRGIGTGIPRALRAHPRIDFIDDPEANRFRSVIWRGDRPVGQ